MQNTPNPWSDETQGSAPSLGRHDALDFLDAMKHNQRNTWLLMTGMFSLAAGFGYILGWGWDLAFGRGMAGALRYHMNGEVDWQLMMLTPSQTGIMVAVSLFAAMLVWCLYTFHSADKVILEKTEAIPVSASVMPQLHNIVEEMAIAAGVRKPSIVIIQTDVPNAFAAGLDSENATIGVTQGLLSRLNRDELQGVIAHEMSHVVNGDMRFATVLAVMTGVLTFISQFILNARYFMMSGGGKSARAKGGHPAALLIMVCIFLLTAILVPIIAKMIQMAVSRQREYLADANAIKLTRNPQGLIQALHKIANDQAPAHQLNPAFEPLFIVTPARMWHKGNMAWFSTHPPLEKRIERLKALE